VTSQLIRTRGRSILAASVVVGWLLLGQWAPASAATTTVQISNGGLAPQSLTIAPGTTVKWVNGSSDRRKIRSTSGPDEFEGDLQPGASFTFTFTAPGTYQYRDDRNPDLSNYWGTVVVRSGAPAPTPPPAPGATPPPPPPPSTGATVRMAGKRFTPGTLTVNAGTRVTFLNDDGRDHTVTAGDGSFDSGVVGQGQTFVRTFSTAGTFSYLCVIHSGMTGTIAVRGSGGAPPPPPRPTPTPPPAAPPPPGTTSISIIDFDFTPATFTGPVGTRVTWTNRGVAPHTVTANDGSFDSGLIASGRTFSRLFATPGTFVYICTIHQSMQATVRITSASGSVPPPAPPAPRPTPPPVARGRLVIADFAFRPASITVSPGTTLVWQNTGVAPHTVTSRAGLFDSKFIASGATYSHTFTKPGTYPYLCAIHPDMTGTVLVPGANGVLPPPQPPPPAPPPSVAGNVQIIDFGFSPSTFKVPVGTTVRWVNVGVTQHTATARDGSFDSGFLETGDRFAHTFNTPATIEYICSIHPAMVGVLIVTDAAGAAPSPEPSPSPGAGASAPPGAASVDLADFAFQPPSLSIPAGTSVVFHNIGAALHTATADDTSWDTGFLEPDASIVLRFDTVGSFSYACTIHPAMVGTIDVTAATGSQAPDAAAGSPSPPPAAAGAPGGAPPSAASLGGQAVGWGLMEWLRVAFVVGIVGGSLWVFIRVVVGSANRPT
jgi:plastocyanin